MSLARPPSPFELAAERYAETTQRRTTWAEIARPEQLPPPHRVSIAGQVVLWFIWLIVAGRGAGKTRSGAEWAAEMGRKYPGARIALVAATRADARDVMVEGDSGLLSVLDESELRGGSVDKAWNRSLGELFLANGTRYKCYSSEKPRQLRGPQNHFGWCLSRGTPVETAHGAVAIENVQIGDLVLTRRGYRPVIGTGARMAQMWDVVLADGRSIRGSAEHPVMTDRGWTPLSRLRTDDTVLVWADDGGRIDAGMCTARRVVPPSCSTGPSGKSTTGRSPRVDPFTTSTTTGPITESRTSPCSPAVSTGSRIADPEISTAPTAAPSFLRDTIGLDTARSAGTALPNLVDTARNDSAWSAEPSSAPGLIEVRCIAVSHVSTLGVIGDVYNLAVAGESEFFANGILTHNCDEIAQWTDAKLGVADQNSTWSNLVINVRLPARPEWDATEYATRIVATTTPKRVPLLKVPPDVLRAEPHRAGLLQQPRVVVTRGRTDDNLDNLSETYLENVVEPLRGTRLGRQELDAEYLEDVEGAFWNSEDLEADRVRPGDMPPLVSIITAVDPAMTNKPTSAETGIVTVARGLDDQGYCLGDVSGRFSPLDWGVAVWRAALEHGSEAIVVEDNQGGDLVESNLAAAWPLVAAEYARAGRLPPPVRRITAQANKRARAASIAVMSERHVMHHVYGAPLELLEDQLTGWDGEGDSPDRLDAYVHGLRWLFLPQTRRDSGSGVTAGQRWGAIRTVR